MNTYKKFIFGLFLVSFFFLFPKNIEAQVVINEFLPNSAQEWVEFFNSGPSVEDLSNYYFDDDNNFGSDSGNSAKIALSGILQTLGSCYLDLSTVLNNNGDTPTLFKLDGTVADTYLYSTTVSEKSYSRVPDGGSWQQEQVPTKSLVRCSDSAPTPTPTPTPSPSPNPTQTSTSTPTTTATSSPTKTPTPKPTPTKSPTPTPSSLPEVLGESTSEPTLEPTIEVGSETVNKKKFPFLPVILIGSGLSMVGLAVLQLINAAKGNKTDSPLAPPDNMGGSDL